MSETEAIRPGTYTLSEPLRISTGDVQEALDEAVRKGTATFEPAPRSSTRAQWPAMSDDFRFGDPRGTDASDDLGGCCGKPVGCRIESRGCVRKPEKADWQALADRADPSEPA